MLKLRHKIQIIPLCFVVSFLMIVGCNVNQVHGASKKFNGKIEYRNLSKDMLYVSDLTGFEDPASCGYLAAGSGPGDKSLEFGPMSYPAQSTIKWRVGEGPEKSQVLDLGSSANPSPKAMLVFEYTAERKWVAFFEGQ